MRKRPLSFLPPLLHALAVELLSALFLPGRARASCQHQPRHCAHRLRALAAVLHDCLHAAGLGLVEASLSVLLISFGVPKANAIAVAVTFRLFDFWLPVLLGVISLLILRRQTREAMEIVK